jgi:hypothetical protein
MRHPIPRHPTSADLEWYRDFYGAPLDEGSSALDIAHMRRSLPAANCIRFVAL